MTVTATRGTLLNARLRSLVGANIVYLGFIAILIFFAIVLRDRGFLTLSNFASIFRQTAPITIMAIGLTFTLSAGEIDLSVGATVAVSATVGAILLRDYGLVAGVGGGLIVGVVIGLINGVLTVGVRIPSFLVTLGMMGVGQGLARNVTDLQAIPVTNPTFTDWFGSGTLGPIPSLVVWTAVAVVLGHLYLNHTRFGRHVLATGGDRQAADYVGIRTGRIRVAVLVLSAVAASVAGLLYTGRLHGARYTLGEADMLTAIAAVVVGGTNLFGGRGSVIGALFGSLILGMLNNGLILMGLDVSDQMIARGAIIVLAVALSLREARKT